MNDLISTMLRLPIQLAQISAEQFRQVLRQGGSTKSSREPGLHAGGSLGQTNELFSSMFSAGQRFLNALSENPNTDTNFNPQRKTSTVAFTSTTEPDGDGPARKTRDGPHSFKSPGARNATYAVTRTVPKVTRASFGRLDVSTMVVIGDDMTAGLGDFGLSSESQQMSIPAQLARHFGTNFKQPLLEPPGFALGFASHHRNIRLPDLAQTRVFAEFPPEECGNLSVPGFYVEDCLLLRPALPLIRPDNAKQTLANLILDPRHLIQGSKWDARSQLDCALEHGPTFALVSLGFMNVLDEAQQHDTGRRFSLGELRRNYDTILQKLCDGNRSVLVLNVPNPLDMACFSSLESAARLLKYSVKKLSQAYELQKSDYLTVAGLFEVGNQILRREHRPLDRTHILRSQQAEYISASVCKLNEVLEHAVTQSSGAKLCRMSDDIRELAQHGHNVGSSHLTADYLGGLYGLNGISLGNTGQAILANCVIKSINDCYEASLPFIQIQDIYTNDPVASHQTAQGHSWPDERCEQLRSHGRECPRDNNDAHRSDTDSAASELNSGTSLDDAQLERRYNSIYRDAPGKQLLLPNGLTQVLPLSKRVSCFGDAIYVSHCQQLDDSAFGRCAHQHFGGLAIFCANLAGNLRIDFTPIDDRNARFQVTIEHELVANDGELATPSFYRMPVRDGKVASWSGPVCTGNLDLVSGETTDVQTSFRFSNSALDSLARLNPRIQGQPVSFPGAYGTLLVRFAQRSDGKLDFIFHGTTFIPLGSRARFPLPFGSPTGEFASIPANDSQLHPYLYLSTAHSDGGSQRGRAWIPTNTKCEFTSDVSRTSFGDNFTLNHPDLGTAQGRSHLAGRVIVQFGQQTGDLVPFSIRMLPPAGAFNSRTLLPLQSIFPGRLVPGMIGHDAVLRFNARQYRQSDLYLLDDPFDIPIGVVNAYTGEVVGDFVHRGLLGQALFFALVRVEPRTPQGSFQYRGPARFERGPNGQIRFRFNGTVFLPYQEGFLWPLPDLSNGIPIGPGSRLDPFLQIQATYEPTERCMHKTGSAHMQTATTGDRFSYEYSMSSDNHIKSRFQYTNHSQGATFAMHTLISLDFMESDHSHDDCKIVTFTCFGNWSRDTVKKLRTAAVQISTDTKRPYVSILIDGGLVSNVNTALNSEWPPLTDLDKPQSNPNE